MQSMKTSICVTHPRLSEMGAVNVQELSAKSAHQYRKKKTLECMTSEQAFVVKQGSI